MLCQECNERQATVHLTQIMGDKMTKRDLCEVCGKEFVDAAKSGHWNQSGIPLFDQTGKILDGLVACDSRYLKAAYLFVQEGLSKAQNMFWEPGKSPGHISGAQLLEGLRELAIESFGKRAKATLNAWGVFKCKDFGEIVFNLIEAGLMSKRETDTKNDFQGGYDFDTAFPS
jgi:uncharacterized repeat protein (TIGR04138 family)